MSSRALACLALLASVFCAGQSSAPAPGTFRLSGHVIGGSGKHYLHVALWDRAGFLDQPVREIVVHPGEQAEFRFEVPRGRWALSAYDDLNDNGKLDMGAFGPKEPNGFWRAFHGWHKPHFDEVAIEVDRDILDADIHLSGH